MKNRSLPTTIRAVVSSCVTVCFSASMAVVAVPAYAQGDGERSLVDEARAAYNKLDYSVCAENAGQALATAGSLVMRIDAYKYLGLCSAALGETETARDAFIKMLAINPDEKLPDGLSPRFTSSYREAKGQWVDAGKPIALTIASDNTEEDVRTLEISVKDDAGLIIKVAQRRVGGDISPPVRVAAKLAFEIPTNADVEIIGLDKAGGEVALLRVNKPQTATKIGNGNGNGNGGIGDTDPNKDGNKKRLDPNDPKPETDEVPWVLIGAGSGAAVLVLGTVGILAAVLTPPSSVSLRSQIVFGSSDFAQ